MSCETLTYSSHIWGITGLLMNRICRFWIQEMLFVWIKTPKRILEVLTTLLCTMKRATHGPLNGIL